MNNHPQHSITQRLGQDTSTVWKINGQFLVAVLCSLLALVFWSLSSRDWWFFGFLAWLCAAAGVGQFINTFRLLKRHIGRERKLRDYEELGSSPKADAFADKDRLSQDGIVE